MAVQVTTVAASSGSGEEKTIINVMREMKETPKKRFLLHNFIRRQWALQMQPSPYVGRFAIITPEDGTTVIPDVDHEAEEPRRHHCCDRWILMQ